jgi:hypothetical protein
MLCSYGANLDIIALKPPENGGHVTVMHTKRHISSLSQGFAA